ncbi:hypothetical protein OSE20_002846 [Listeria innocua]|nr:hypothetical protein [Listeria innocua]EKD7152027.1 hypothetical protein [Listeria innocua]EKK7208470.1 hypothetical protein [Listeria innocua]HBN5051459.1 hypothetical protein [Listeria innocua]
MTREAYTYRIVRLKETYFNKNPNLINMLDPNKPQKQNRRTYLYLDFQKDYYHYLVPLRSNLNHKNGFPVPSKQRPNAGLDYSHTLVIKNKDYIERAVIPTEQYQQIKSNIAPIYRKTSQYITNYMKNYMQGKALDIPRYQHSTLINYVSYLEKGWSKKLDYENKQRMTIKDLENKTYRRR